ncbi:unnamed protein product [Mucor fragilis]
MSAAWDKLPFEVLIHIFAYSVDTKTQYIQSRRALYSYQLVCKGWSKAAQSLLYRHISCQDDPKEGELLRFVDLIYTLQVLAPHVGTFVKTITVCDHLYSLGEPLKALDVIFSKCPKLEEFYCNGSSKEVAWPYLLTLPDTRVANIRSIAEDTDFCEYPHLYPFVAFKLRNSLSKLHHVEIQGIQSWGSTYLLNHLSQFVSLQELSLCRCEFASYKRLCEVFDKCSPTVSKLSICKYWASLNLGDAATREITNPNFSIREISISNSVMDTVSYFVVKFPNLQKLTMDQVVSSQITSPEWFHGLMDLCISLKEYGFRFNLGLEALIKDSCVDLTKKSSPKDTFLSIDYSAKPGEDLDDTEDDMSNPSWGIILKKDGTRSGIEVILPWMHPDDIVITPESDHHLNWFDGYSPNQITIDHIETSDFMNSEQKYKDLFMATTFTEFALGFRDADRHKLVEVKNWAILTRALFSTVDSMDAEVSFSNMVIPNLKGRTTHLEKSSSPNVKHLAFIDSILYHQVLAVISSWLPKLDTLLLDACYILMEKPYTLRINMQETILRRLVIVAAPAMPEGSLPDEPTIVRDQLENVNFTDALLPGNQYTLRIEANGKTYLLKVIDGISWPVKDPGQADCHGTSGNFLIWIQCKKLEEVSIVDGLDIDATEHQFIPLD